MKLYDDDPEEDDDHTLHYVSKRESGAFSPLAEFQQNRHNDEKNEEQNEDGNSGYPRDDHARDQSPSIQTPSAMRSRGENEYNPMPVETPMDDVHMSVSRKYNNPISSVSKPRTMPTPKPMAAFVSRASLDGDYRPYHDALQFLLVQSKSSSSLLSKVSNSRLNTTEKPSASLQYLRRITACAYSRATRLKEEQKQPELTTTNSSARSVLETTIRRLEREGHLGSLVYRLAERSMTVVENESRKRYFCDMLLYDPPNVTTVEREIQACIASLLEGNEDLDLAAMDQLVQESLRSMKEEVGDKIPIVVMRRQTVLDWLESCHYKTLSSQDWIAGNGNKSSVVMWKDTLAKLDGDQHSFMSSIHTNRQDDFKDKVRELHPDAPLIAISKSRQGGTFHDAPLFGNDNKREIDLLEKCLLLLKAGKMNQVLELCHEAGQPWRAAAWEGDAPHGYVAIMHMDNSGGEEKENEMEDADGNMLVLVGNPQRPLWKRTMWENSKALHSLLLQKKKAHHRLEQMDDSVNRSSAGQEESTVSSGSLVYEAAISAILANDSMTAFQNPLLSKDWMDSIWVYYHGLQARFRECVYHAHNNIRRGVERQGYGSSNLPMDGTEYDKEEKEQLQCTSELSRLEEGAFISRLAARNGMKSFGDWDQGISSFLMGMNEAQTYMKNSIHSLIDAATQKKKNTHDGHDSFLRFMLHLVLFFESLCGPDDTAVSIFYSNAILPQRNELILVYLEQLMKHQPLWEFYNLYASILPEDLLIDACTNFWSTSVFDERSRRMVLKSAREYFDKGTDILILRNVVRSDLAPIEEYRDPLRVAAWLGDPMDSERYDDELESMISIDDIRKMHSIRWMLLYNEHYADAIICANMFLRGFLLDFCMSDETPEDEEFDDWTNSPKVYTAKVFQARFLPENILEIATQSFYKTEYQIDQDDVDDYVAEYQALVQFLDAHNAYESWKEYISEVSATVAFNRDSMFEDNTVESDVAMKMEVMKYVKKKKEIAQGLIKVATVAKDALLQVLEFENGWLCSSVDVKDLDNGMDESFNRERSERYSQVKLLRSKCLPTAVSLLFRVCHTTALWMEEFSRDVKVQFENDSTDIFARISGHGFFESQGLPNPFQSVTWHQTALLMANSVASSDTKIAECMSKEELASFMRCMVETNICLLRIQEQNNHQN